ncbi:MAG: hypothetical protein WAT53_09150 [Nitrosomonas sp.]|jgi:hypothetical protein|nr:hypothetical protein [Nitrosomonas sp.]MCC7136156.1 hypothetical protein [Nitrosomonas sp.]
MGYDAETTQRETTKEKSGWMVAIGSTVAFIIIGAIIWSSGMGGKY